MRIRSQASRRGSAAMGNWVDLSARSVRLRRHRSWGTRRYWCRLKDNLSRRLSCNVICRSLQIRSNHISPPPIRDGPRRTFISVCRLRYNSVITTAGRRQVKLVASAMQQIQLSQRRCRCGEHLVGSVDSDLIMFDIQQCEWQWPIQLSAA